MYVLKQAVIILITSLTGTQMMKVVKFDFESSNQLPTVLNSQQPNLHYSNKSKEGKNSMRWVWSSGTNSMVEMLEWDLNAYSIMGRPTRMGGIKFHVYNIEPITGNCLKMCITQRAAAPSCGQQTLKSCFFTSLNFKGWRAVWVSYKEFRGCQTPVSTDINCFNGGQIEKFTIEAPKSAAPSPVYFDDLQFVVSIVKQTRDRIVPPVQNKNGDVCFSCADFESGITEADAIKRHPRNEFWNQAYRWDLKERSTQMPSSRHGHSVTELRDLLTIKKRLLSWYIGDDISFKSPYLAASRWGSLLGTTIPTSDCDFQSGTIKCSHILYDNIKIDSYLTTPEGLYCKNCDKGKLKFASIFHKILLPMAIDYRIWAEADIKACMLAKRFGCKTLDATQLNEFKTYITGSNHSSMSSEFDSWFSNRQLQPSSNGALQCQGVQENCADRFVPVIRRLNAIKKEKILKIFKYVRDQGFAEGSSLGSLGHQMLTGSGYMHAAFLIADAIDDANDKDITLGNLIDTMKWYSDFGEIYQNKFEYQGTTGDKVRTDVLFKLLAIMSMPESNDIEKRKKIRDMTKLKKLIDNSMLLNEGTLGLLKPDLLGFHHQFYYGGHYVPDALYTMSFITYLLDNTAFELSVESKLNLKKALEFQRIVAVKYSIPPSVDGRYPFYNRVQLANKVPSYLYLVIKSPTMNAVGRLGSIQLKGNSNAAGIYKRLMKQRIDCACPKTTCPLSRLCNGKAGSIVYLNTIGEAEVIDNLGDLLSSQPAEISPRGNWAKNYAALSVHRRDDWTVTVKGFNHLVLGPERYSSENVYGLFAAHGAILIANSEEALKTKNVDGGWDWTKIPGTTAIDMTDNEIKIIRSSRYKNQRALAGGVSFYGTRNGDDYSNGVFGMDFEMPPITQRRRNILTGESFRLKKSVFFFNNILVCLGSRIESTVKNKAVVTSLFQDTAWTIPLHSPKLFDRFYCNNGDTEMRKYNFVNDTILVDRHGNKYYIPGSVSSQLRFHRNVQQHSKAQSGKKDGTGTYCKAWFDHGIAPSNAIYNYIIEINAVPFPHDQAADKGDAIDIREYEILQQTDNIHTVKHSTVCGHVIFNKSAKVPNHCPVKTASEPCIIMTKLTLDSKLEISISFPQMNLHKDDSASIADPTLCVDPLPSPKVGPGKSGSSMLFCTKDNGKNIDLTLHSGIEATTIFSIEIDGDVIDPKDFSTYAHVVNKNEIQILNLKHGKSMDIGVDLT